ncbi:CYFA0S08e01970g1_1 [Cyberlindnera fabianii]|uniref:CYFA0S08e01970g1_1 n=1 Tax=Cyberlindnera fabianii TaxID=36022 RepID=A0A061B2T1_CYBFA|nr:CYFA0S08e01970g1_1 [Cyberlindnera fabianii]
MRFQPLLTFAACFSAVRALQLSIGVFRTTLGDQQFTVNSPAAPVTLDSVNSKIDITFDLEGTKRIPEQIFIKLTNKNGIETSFKPITRVDSTTFTNKFTLSYSKLPKIFTASKELDVSIIAGDVTDSKPIHARVGQIQLADALVAQSTYKKTEKFGPKPEIHHIFQGPPKSVSSVIALAFASMSVLCLIVLIGVWASQGALNFKNFAGVGLNHFVFIGLIISYEVVFFQYYLGSTIFETILRVLVLLGPSLWFGSKVLNHVGALRLAGKR